MPSNDESVDERGSRVEVVQDGAPVAFAEVDHPHGSTAVRATLHVEAGHRAPGTVAGLVDAVLDDPAAQRSDAVVAVVPRGQAEAIEHIQERLESCTIRSAGSSVIIEGQLPDEE
jgi:hypothetical protein